MQGDFSVVDLALSNYSLPWNIVLNWTVAEAKQPKSMLSN